MAEAVELLASPQNYIFCGHISETRAWSLLIPFDLWSQLLVPGAELNQPRSSLDWLRCGRRAPKGDPHAARNLNLAVPSRLLRGARLRGREPDRDRAKPFKVTHEHACR